MSLESIINNITILDKDGNPKAIEGGTGTRITGDVELVGGLGMDVQYDDNDEALEIGVDSSGAGDDPVYKAKWLNIINGAGGYSGVPYYISSFNKIGPAPDGTFFLLGGLCPQIGLFSRPNDPVLYPSAIPNTLEFFDMCEACVDCADYQLLFKYLDRINEWLDANELNNLTGGLKLFKQYQALVYYWNYLVTSQSMVLTANWAGDGVKVLAGYRCFDCGPFNDVRIIVKIEQASEDYIEGEWVLQSVNSDPQDIEVDVILDASDGDYQSDESSDSSTSDSSASPLSESSSSSRSVSSSSQSIYSDSSTSDSSASPSSESSSSDRSFTEDIVVIDIAEIDKDESVLVDIAYNTALNSSSGSLSSSSSSEIPYTTGVYKVIATWYNTHIGTSVSREKIVRIRKE
jgi:hypothetical protein